jgi:hypothetical protein
MLGEGWQGTEASHMDIHGPVRLQDPHKGGNAIGRAKQRAVELMTRSCLSDVSRLFMNIGPVAAQRKAHSANAAAETRQE